MSLFRKRVAAFASNAEGSIATMGAIAAVPIVVGIAGLASYANAVSVKQQTQAAADAAALAATTSYLNYRFPTGGNSQAEALALSYFRMNAPATAIANTTSLSAALSVTDSKVSTTVNYCGSMPSLFSSILGGSTNACAAATSSAPTKFKQRMFGAQSGNSEVWGDPHVWGATGPSGMLTCADGAWMNIFSDYQIQVNAQCKSWGDGLNLANNVIADVAITVGSHRLYIQSNYSQAAQWGSIFKGVVTVDGRTVTPDRAGSFPLVSDSNLGLKATDEYWYPNSGPVAKVAGGRGANYVEVKTMDYDLIVSFNAYTVIELSALRTGACATPSGVLGQTYDSTGSRDWDGSHFETPGNDPWWLDANFSTTCATKTVAESQGRVVITQ